MSLPQLTEVLTVTDVDGDVLTVERIEDGDRAGFFFTSISGEDGHRAVVLSKTDALHIVAALTAVL